jgi:hypothetical protein
MVSAFADRMKKGQLFAALIMVTLLHGYSVAGVYAAAVRRLCASIASHFH